MLRVVKSDLQLLEGHFESSGKVELSAFEEGRYVKVANIVFHVLKPKQTTDAARNAV